MLLKDGAPQAVWTGSTNWTDGALYGQLNYESYFQLLRGDPSARALKAALSNLTPVPSDLSSGPCAVPLFSPQPDRKMLDLYASICSGATHLMVCAPFELAPEIQKALETAAPNTLRFLLIDKTGSLGSAQEERVIAGDTGTEVSVATTLSGPLHDFQNHILEGKESYHH